MHNVSSWFIDQSKLKNSKPVRRFLVDSADYSDYVTRWPSIKRSWDQVRPGPLSVALSNEDKTFNIFKSNKLNFKKLGSLQIGYDYSDNPPVNKLLASDGLPGDQNGISVSIDGTLCIAGAFTSDSSGTDAGAAYIYIGSSNNVWVQDVKIQASDASSHSWFGLSVSIFRETVVIGAPQDNLGGATSYAGAAYIFVNSSNGDWGAGTKIQAASPFAGSLFGVDVDNDNDTIIIGSNRDSFPGAAGISHVFIGSMESYAEQQQLNASDFYGDDKFGTSVSVYSNTAICGAPNSHPNSSFEGAAYVFTRSDFLTGSWTEQQILRPLDLSSGDNFGYSVGIYGETAIIGAHLQSNSGTNSGAAYIYTRSANSWTLQQKIIGSDTKSGNWFGFSVSVFGDNAVVGARLESTGGSVSGAAYEFKEKNGVWGEARKIKPIDNSSGNQYGYSVNVNSGLYIVGAAQENELGGGAGAAYAYNSSGKEYITVYDGEIEVISYKRGLATIKLQDRMKQLTERVMGDRENAVIFSGSNILPSDIFWTTCTCYGGLSSIASTSNPDIDYTLFQEWAAVFSGDSVFMEAEFKGVKCIEVLRKLARYTYSTITVDGTKIFTKRFTQASSENINFDDAVIQDLSLKIDDHDMINRQHVYGDYNTSSNEWAISVVDDDTASINSYGLHEHIEKDSNIWYTNSVSCINLAQRKSSLSAEPQERYKLDTTLYPLTNHIGDLVSITDNQLGINAESFRMMGYNLNMDTGEIKIDADKTQLLDGFTLDVTSLDGTEVLI